jgi:hypothetical protein
MLGLEILAYGHETLRQKDAVLFQSQKHGVLDLESRSVIGDQMSIGMINGVKRQSKSAFSAGK